MGEVINLTDDDSTEGVPEGEVVKKTQKRSFVWTYFDKDAAKSTSKGGETRVMVTCLARKGKIGGKYVSKYKCGDELTLNNVDPLQWWKIHRTDFPNLFRMAKVRQSSNTSNFRRIIWQFLPLRHQLNVSFLVGRG